MSKTRVIVTGGAGFIGSHLVDFLIKKGFEILVIDNLSSSNKNNLNPKAFFEKLDIKKSGQINKCFKKFLPDFVVHLAGVTSKSLLNTNKVFQNNVLGTTYILKACVKNNVKKIIFASSAAVYGKTVSFPTDENQKPSPLNSYGFSKIKAESKILFYHKKYNLNYSILRYSNVYGPGQKDSMEGGVVSIFCNKTLLSKKVIVYGDGQQTRDFVYIDDVTRANYLSMISPTNFTVNVSTNKETSILNLLEIIKDISKKKNNVIFKPFKDKEIRRSRLSNLLIKQKTNWSPKIKLEKGIKKTYNIR